VGKIVFFFGSEWVKLSNNTRSWNWI